MTEAEWLTCDEPGPMLGTILSQASARKLRFFGCACCRGVFQYMEHEGSRALTHLIERYADKHATADELEAARRTHDQLCHAPLRDWEYLNAADEAALLAAFTDISLMIAHVASLAAKAVVDTQAVPSRIELDRRSSEATERLVYPLEPGSLDEYFSTLRSLQDQQGAVETALRSQEGRVQAAYLRDIFGNPFRPVATDSDWHTSTVIALAKQMYESRDFSPMPILADALQDAGCDCEDILSHCRGPGLHVRGCWAVDLILGKE